MRIHAMLAAVAVLATGAATSSAPDGAAIQLAQTGPLPTSIVNPGLGSAPPGGHLGEPGRAATGASVPGAVTPPANAGARLGGVTDRVGAPPVNAVPNAPVGAVPPPAAGAVPPPAAGAVPPATGAVPPAAPLGGR